MARWYRPRRTAFVMAAALMFNAMPVYGSGYEGRLAESFADDEQKASSSDAEKATPANAFMSLRQEEGTVYYVDAVNGDDSKDGKTEETAWKSFDRVNAKTFLPGDKILLKADGIWNQPLNPKGSGREGAPIIIDMYGEGNRPVINGNGTSGPSITGAVTIYNEEHWEIYNLEVTNLEATDQAGESMDSGTSERAGILIYSSNQEKIYDHIVVKNCYVHDVNSNLKGMKTSGGIIVIGHYLDQDGKRVTIDDNGNLAAKAMGRAAFSDVVIEGNYVKNVAVEGIRNKCNTDITSSGWGKNEFLKNFSDVTIRNNYLQDVAGDGIVLTETIGGLVEGNMVNSSCGMDRGKTNYAQCWTMFADDVVIQYNEVYGNKYGYDDGEAFDSDMMNKNNIFQYNLSHDCGGGAMLFMASQENTIFRYNISINDGFGTFPNGQQMQQQIFHYDNTPSDTGNRVGKVYNNTIVSFGQGKKTALFGGKSKKTCFIDFKNNIVLAQDGTTVTFAPIEGTGEDNQPLLSVIHPDSKIENNCIWPESILDTRNGDFLTKENLEKSGNIIADPQLVDYEAGKDYSEFVFPLENLKDLADSEFTKEQIQKRAEPYQLTENSPCIRAGQRIEGMPTQDLMGNTIAGRVDIGALEFSVEDEEAESVEEVKLVTMVGVKPELPDTLQVTMDSNTYEYPVEWDELMEEDWMKAGTIELHGSLPGLSNQVTAMIVVTNQAESVDEVEVSTYAGVYPLLPEYVKATFEGGITMDMKVEWEKLDLETYSKEGMVEVKGHSGNLETEFLAKVTIIGTIGDGKSIQEVSVAKDAFIQEIDADTAYGADASSQNVIKIKTASTDGRYTRRGLVGFDLTGQEASIDSATKILIKMQMVRPVSDADYKNINKGFYLNVYEIEDGAWEENTVTWNNVPKAEKDNLIFENKKIVYTDIRDLHNNIVELDVTDWVKKAYSQNKQTKFSFLMTTEYYGEFNNGDNGGIDFASKERSGAMAPTMVLSNVYEVGTEELTVSTPAGKAPVLPDQVKVMYSDDTEKKVSVEWDEIRPASYGTQGTFQVWGKAEGVSIPVVCKVTVLEAMAKVVAVKELQPIIQMTETAWEDLGLPETVTVVLDNGQEADVKIQYWFPDCAYDPTKEFFYTCIGYLDLEGHESIENPRQMVATVNVSIIEPEDKNALLSLYTEVADLLNQGEAEKLTPAAKDSFMKVFNKASEILVDYKASREEVHQAYWDLMNAVWDLEKEENLKADTQKLEDLILIGESKNKKDYTEESYEVLKDALERAKEVLKDKTLTVRDQNVVDEAYDELKEAIDSLEFSEKPEETKKIMTEIKITSLPEKLEYKVGEAFSMKGLSVEAVFDDGTTKHISGYDISGANTSVPGTKTVVVTYRVAVNDEIKVFTDSFEIVVKENGDSKPDETKKVMTGIRITSLPEKTEYEAGEAFSMKGLSVEAVYDDKTTKPVSGYDISGTDTSVPGTKTVVVTYRVALNDEIQEFTDTFEIVVKEHKDDKPEETKKVITGIRITSLPEKTEYKAGEAFSAKGLSVEAVYDNGTTKPVSGYDVSGTDTSVPGTKTVVVTYRVALNNEIQEFTDTFEIVVKENEDNKPDETKKVMTGIRITSLPEKTEYEAGEAFSMKGLSVEAVYDDGTTKPVSGYDISGTDTSVPGTKTVVVTYRVALNNEIQEFTDTFEIVVKENEDNKPEETKKMMTGIRITSLPEKTEYEAGEAFSAKGLSVEAVYNDGTTKSIRGYDISGTDTSVPGTKTVVIMYRIALNDEIQEFTDTFEIVVKENGDDKPGTDEPGTDKPGTDQPGTDQPGTDEPGTDQPGTDKPGTDQPGTDQPGTDKPGTDEPGTDQPGTDKPGTDQPGTDQPGTDQPGTDQPGTDQPGTDKPGTDQPGTDQPGTDQPGTDEPGTDQPGTDKPGTDQPGTDEPGTDQPGTDKPGTNKPWVSRPGSSGKGQSSTKGNAKAGVWSQEGSSWKLKKADGSYAANEWKQVDGKWYHFNQKGDMQTGWFADGQNWYRLGENGAMETGWVKDTDGFWYYLDENGVMKVGWVLVHGRWYYLNPISQGHTGWSSDEDGSWSLGTPEEGSRPLGALYLDEKTPDGYEVNADGAREE